MSMARRENLKSFHQVTNTKEKHTVNTWLILGIRSLSRDPDASDDDVIFLRTSPNS